MGNDKTWTNSGLGSLHCVNNLLHFLQGSWLLSTVQLIRQLTTETHTHTHTHTQSFMQSDSCTSHSQRFTVSHSTFVQVLPKTMLEPKPT